VHPFASRALVVTARALEEENIELSIIGIWRLSVEFWGAGRLLIGADSLDTLSFNNILLSPIQLYGSLCNFSLAFFGEDEPFNLLTNVRRAIKKYKIVGFLDFP
jgi:hypothetical protein